MNRKEIHRIKYYIKNLTKMPKEKVCQTFAKRDYFYAQTTNLRSKILIICTINVGEFIQPKTHRIQDF